MATFIDDDVIIPFENSADVVDDVATRSKLRRLKKASSPPRTLPSPQPSPDPNDLIIPVLESEEIEEKIDRKDTEEDELEPLFPDPGALKAWEPLDPESVEEEFDGGELTRENLSKRKFDDEGGDVAEKILVDEGEDKKMKKKKRVGKEEMENTKELERGKKRAEKERKSQLAQIHAESQRLLRETSDVTFKPVPVVQKPISSVLEKIRMRKLEVLKKYNVHVTTESTTDLNDSLAETSQFTEQPASLEKDRDYTKPKDLFSHNADAERGKTSNGDSDDSEDSKDPELVSEDANDILDADASNLKVFSDKTEHSVGEEKLKDPVDHSTEDIVLPSPPSLRTNLDLADISSEEDNVKEKVATKPSNKHKSGLYTETGYAKAFVDDEAEEEDDSDHDMMRFQENEEDDESDDNDDDAEDIQDLIATGFTEAPVEEEKRNELHQKWLELQDAAATDNVLQKIKYGKKKKEPMLLHAEDDMEELSEENELSESEELEEEKSSDLPPTTVAIKNSKLAKQMVAKMFSDDNDDYVLTDDDEIEDTLVRQRLLKQEDSTFLSATEDDSSSQVFGLIKKLNVVPDSKKRMKTSTSNFDMLVTRGSSNSSSKSSFLGRSLSCSAQSSNKQGSGRAFIFGRDDSNSRSGLSKSENPSEMDQLENEPKKASSTKLSRPNINSTASVAKDVSSTTSGPSLFQILKQSSINFDKQMEAKMGSSARANEVTYQFSAFKSTKKFHSFKQKAEGQSRKD